MPFAVRPADLERDRKAILALLVDHFADWRVEGKYDWLYVRNPMGPPRTWLLEDGSGKAVGVSSAFPRRIRAGHRSLEAWVLGDFVVGKEQRSLGPAIALQRETCERVDAGEVDLWYDFPNRAMAAIYGRMGIGQKAEMIRLVYPLRVDRMVEERVPNRVVAAGLRELGNKLLESRDSIRRRDSGIEVAPREGEFEGDVAAGRETRDGVTLDRTASYLNWRHRDDPRGPATILCARRARSEPGFLAYRWSEPDELQIGDAFGIEEPGILRELVLEAVAIARSRGGARVTVGLSNRHPWLPTFERLGFHQRESVPVFVYARSGVLAPDLPWFLMAGDRD
jgi:hypothetical protein